MQPAPFELLQIGGQRAATNGQQTLQLVAEDGRIFRRRAIKCAGTPNAHAVEWAVAELGDVRVYVDGAKVIMTRADLLP